MKKLLAIIFLFLTLSLVPCTLNLVFAQTYTLTGNMCGTGLTGDTCVGKGSTGEGSGLVSETYPAGTKVTLTPSAKTGYIFVGWLGEGLWGNKTTSIMVSGRREVRYYAGRMQPLLRTLHRPRRY
jgi:uncharacterized repeat protein (TIGR02543 family)